MKTLDRRASIAHQQRLAVNKIRNRACVVYFHGKPKQCDLRPRHAIHKEPVEALGMSEIHETAVIGDYVTVGDGCYIGPFCYITGRTVIGHLVRLEAHVSIGAPPQHLAHLDREGEVKIGTGTTIREVRNGQCRDRSNNGCWRTVLTDERRPRFARHHG